MTEPRKLRLYEFVNSYSNVLSSTLGIEPNIAKNEVKILMRHCMQITLEFMVCQYHSCVNDLIQPNQLKEFENLFNKRLKGYPLAYLTNETYFYNLSFFVNDHVLIPRSDSEVLVDAVIKDFSDSKSYPSENILELGVGSGCLIISIMNEVQKHSSNFSGVGIDKSSNAIEVARKNSIDCSINNLLLLNLDWNQSDIIGTLISTCHETFQKNRNHKTTEPESRSCPEQSKSESRSCTEQSKFDIIISNPPYISIDEIYDESIRFEPSSALFSSDNGMQDYKSILNISKHLSNDHTLIYLELGYKTLPAIKDFVQSQGYFYISGIYNDFSGISRVIKLKKILP